MNLIAKCFRMALIAPCLIAGMSGAMAAEPGAAAADTPQLDPAVWGMYARLPGTAWKTEGGSIEWARGPDNSIVETRSGARKSVIRPGAHRGELVWEYGSRYTYDSRTGPDGSILWLRRGQRAKTAALERLVDGRFVEDMVKLDESQQVVKVRMSWSYRQISGPTFNAPSAAPAPAAVAAATGSATSAPAAAVGGNVALAQSPESAVPPSAPPAMEETIFEQLAALNGERLVTSDGFLDIYLEGDALALHFGALDAPRTGQRWLLRRIPGQSDLVILEHPDFGPETYFAQIRDSRKLTVGSIARAGPHGSEYTFDPAEGVTSTNFASDPDTHEVVNVVDRIYARATAQAIAHAESEHNREVAEAAEVKREREEREDANRRGVYNALLQAYDVASAHEAESRAELDATLAQAARQAGGRGRADAYGDTDTVSDRADDATIVAIAQQPAVRSPDASTASGDHDAATATPGKPLRFVLDIGLLNKPGDTVNPTCYSNVITRPGPPGWGGSGFLPDGSAEQARQEVEGLKDHFIALCRATGREISSEGNFHWTWNETRDGDQQVSNAHARYREDVSVNL